MSKPITSSRSTSPSFGSSETAPDIDSVNSHLSPQPLPKLGAVQSYATQEPIAPFEIRSSPGTNYLVKLVDAYSNKDVLSVFVHGGSPVTVKVPLGNYVVKYAAGQTWYGYEHLFGKQTAYSKAETTFEFQKEVTTEGTRINGYTITLYTVHNGNLSTQHIQKDEF